MEDREDGFPAINFEDLVQASDYSVDWSPNVRLDVNKSKRSSGGKKEKGDPKFTLPEVSALACTLLSDTKPALYASA